MKYQRHIAILLLIFFTAVSVMVAGSKPDFNLGSLSVSVSASAQCGEITVIGHCNSHCQQETISHTYDDVTPLTQSNGCSYTLDAKYWISYTVTGDGSTNKPANVKISGHSVVLDVNGNSVGINSSTSPPGTSLSGNISADKDVNGWGIWDGPFRLQKKFKVSQTKGYEWTTGKPGIYKAKVAGQGSATSASGGSSGLTVGGGIPAFYLTIGGSKGKPTMITGHQYYWTESVNNEEINYITFLAEDDFTVDNGLPIDLRTSSSP